MEELEELRTENSRLKEKIAKLEEEAVGRKERIDTAKKQLNEIAISKLAETREELQNAHLTFVTSMTEGMKIAAMPLVTHELIVPLARRFVDWDICFSVHKGFGVAYIDVSKPEDDYDIAILTWRDLTDKDDIRYIHCQVGDGFVYPGWNSDTLTVPTVNLFESLAVVYSKLRELALEYYASHPPAPEPEEPPVELLDTDETPEEILRIPAGLTFEHNGC